MKEEDASLNGHRQVQLKNRRVIQMDLEWHWVALGRHSKDQTTVQHMKVVLIAIITGIFQTNQMTLVKEFGDGVSDDFVMLFFSEHLYRRCCERCNLAVV